MKLSLIVPVYNTAQYLPECLNSIINSKKASTLNAEVLLIDDGSTDSSSVICDNYANKYDFIKVVHKKWWVIRC